MRIFLVFLIFLYFQFDVSAQQDAWVYLADKENVASAIANPITILTQKAIDRKAAHNVAIDASDVPVNESYITQLKSVSGITVLAKSKWFNAVHVRGSQTDINDVSSLSFVSSIDFADKSLNTFKAVQQKNKSKLEKVSTTYNYGFALNQIQMLQGDALHVAGYTGTGMTIAVLDAGFPNVNTMGAFQNLWGTGNILGAYDFVNRDTDVYTNTTSNHGTLVLSDMAGFVQDQFVGTAPQASYYLFITENAPDENPVEESYWVEAAERADSLGVDIINSSLGYTTYDNPNYSYTPTDMDGNTAFISRGANIAFEKGILIVNSAGNSGNGGWQIVGAPADAAGVFSIGAVDANGDYAFFSSRGSSTQPTQKPDVVAQGLASYVIAEDNGIGTASGTSFSSPILAGGMACLWQALPNKTNAEIMQLVRESASQYLNPDYFLGYGIPNLQMALNIALSSENIENIRSHINVYPNPTSGMVYFDFPTYKGELSLTLFDILGNKLYQKMSIKEHDSLDVSFLTNGMYLVKMEFEGKTKSFKLIKN